MHVIFVRIQLRFNAFLFHFCQLLYFSSLSNFARCWICPPEFSHKYIVFLRVKWKFIT